MSDYPEDCDHTDLDIDQVSKDGRYHIEGAMTCNDCGSVFLFRGNPE